MKRLRRMLALLMALAMLATGALAEGLDIIYDGEDDGEAQAPGSSDKGPQVVGDFILEGDTLWQYVGGGSDVSVPYGIRRIKSSAFQNKRFVQHVSLPNSVETLDWSVFNGCGTDNGFTVDWPSSITSIDTGIFDDSGLTDLNIPYGLTYVSDRMFHKCGRLTEVNLPESVTSIGTSAFEECTGLTGINEWGSVNLPDSVEEIKGSAFQDCSAMTRLTIGSNIRKIGMYAFMRCGNLSTVVITGHNIDCDSMAFFLINSGAKFTMYCDSGMCDMISSQGYAVSKVHGEEVVDPAVEPTFTHTGLTQGSHCSVCGEVIVPQEEIPALTGTVTLNRKDTVELVTGKTLKLKATVDPAEYDSYLTWKSSRKSVATVSKTGKVKALKKGTTVISARLPDGSGASVKIKVVAPKPGKVRITNGKSVKLKVRGKLKLKTKLTPANAESKLTWSSSDKTVATVSKKGVVTAKKVGKAVVTVRTANNKKAKITIRVVKK